MKRNENRPGYKVTKVGWIPREWECVKLREFCSTIMDGTHFSPKSKQGNHLYITSRNVRPGKLDLSEVQHISEDEHRNIFLKCPIRKGQILLTKDGAGVGNACINTLDEEFSLLSSVAVLDGDRKRLTNAYLLSWLLSPLGKYLIRNEITGLAITRLTLQTIGVLPISLPPLPEQERIAEVLSAWDRAIALTDRLIDAKQRLKKGLMQQLLTGQMRFAEFGKAVRKKGELPEEWKGYKLGACFAERKETAPDLPLLAITSERGVIPRGEVGRKDTSNADKSKYKRIAPGDIGYNTMRMWQGVSAVSTLEGIVSPAYTICTPKKGHSSNFFGYFFKYPPMINLFHRFSQGLVSDTLNLKFRNFSQVKANVPSEAEQIRIASVLSISDREIELMQRKEIALREQKKGLMQKLLTGEVRVRTESKGIK